MHPGSEGNVILCPLPLLRGRWGPNSKRTSEVMYSSAFPAVGCAGVPLGGTSGQVGPPPAPPPMLPPGLRATNPSQSSSGLCFPQVENSKEKTSKALIPRGSFC